MALNDTHLNILNLDLYDPRDTVVALTFQIADFRNLDSRNGTFSKTIEVPSTKRNDTLLGHSFDLTSEHFFDRNVRKDCVIEHDGVRMLEGVVQLHDVIMRDGFISGYELIIYADNSEIFYLLSQVKLRDLLLEDHIFNNTNIIASWSNNGDSSDGYVYPLIDFGYLQNRANNDVLPIEVFVISFFKKHLLKKCLNIVGYELLSDTLSIPEYRDMILLNSREFVLSEEQIKAISFKAGLTTDLVRQDITGDGVAPYFSRIPIDSETTPLFDNGDDYNITTYEYTVDQGYFGSIKFEANVEIIIEATPSTSNLVIGDNPTVTIAILRNGTIVAQQIITTQALGTQTSGSYTEVVSASVSFSNQNFETGDVFVVNIMVNSDDGTYFNSLGQALNGKVTATVDSETCVFYNEPSEKILENQELDLASLLPDWTAADLLKDMCQNINGVFISKKSDHTFRLETRDIFFKDIEYAEDWTAKVDLQNEGRIVQYDEGLNRNLIFKYKEDRKDDLVLAYNEKFKTTYGKKIVILENEYLNGELNVADLLTSATQMGEAFTESTVAPLYLPRLINQDNIDKDIEDGGIGQSLDFEPRTLIYAGMTAINDNPNEYALFRFLGSSSIAFEYPFCYFIKKISQVNDLSLAFENINEVNTTLQTNDKGLFDRLYSETIRQINYARFYKDYFNISEIDIMNLDFRTPKFLEVNGNKTYFHLNKVDEFIVGENESTKIELIQIPYGNNT